MGCGHGLLGHQNAVQFPYEGYNARGNPRTSNCGWLWPPTGPTGPWPSHDTATLTGSGSVPTSQPLGPHQCGCSSSHHGQTASGHHPYLPVPPGRAPPSASGLHAQGCRSVCACGQGWGWTWGKWWTSSPCRQIVPLCSWSCVVSPGGLTAALPTGAWPESHSLTAMVLHHSPAKREKWG